MNPKLIQKFTEFLKEKGYSQQTIHDYSKALEQAPNTWNTQVPQDLYEHITHTLKIEKEQFLPAARHNIKPASSLLFLMVSGITFKEYSKQSVVNTQSDNILHDFYEYSTGFKSMTELSAQAEQHHVSTFLAYIGVVPTTWSELTAEDLRDYVCGVLSVLKPSSKGRYITSLRNFFRFLNLKESM